MFRSRANEKDRVGDAGLNREVSVPLVKTQDGKEYDPKVNAYFVFYEKIKQTFNLVF